MTQPTEGWHRRAFRGLLLYPRWFREAHGEEMTLLFSARLERAGGELGTDPPLVADDCGCWGDVVAVAPSGQTRGDSFGHASSGPSLRRTPIAQISRRGIFGWVLVRGPASG